MTKASQHIASFSSESDKTATLLILGSMPGVKSLQANQYYAHPQNGFWEILEDITGVSAHADYEERLKGLRQSKIALWDVIAECRREGSLDSSIQTAGLIVNDFQLFFQGHPNLRWVLLNGGKAHQLFKRHVIQADLLPEGISVKALPSTSPAYAAMSFNEKKTRWLRAIREL